VRQFDYADHRTTISGLSDGQTESEDYGMNGTLMLCSILFAAGTWRSYTNTNFINDMCGNDSVLHLATSGGLVKVRVADDWPSVVRTVVNTDGLPVNKCLCVAQDSAGNVWVGTSGGGLAVVPQDSGRAVPYRPTDMPAMVTSLAWDGDRLLVGSEQGLYVVETRGTWLDFSDDGIERWTVLRVPQLLSDKVLTVFSAGGVDDAGFRYWIGTNRGVTAVDQGLTNWVGFRRPLGDSVRAVAAGQGRVIVATELGLARFDSTGFEPLVVFSEPVAVSDLAVAGPDIYLARSDGLFRVDSSGTAGLLLMFEGDARALLVGNTLWLGLGGQEQSGAGLRFLRTGQSWQEFWTPSLGSGSINDCVTNDAGDAYLCHGSFYISVVRPEGVSGVVDPLPLAVQVRHDSQGRLWFAHFAADGGLSCYDPGTNSWQTVQWGSSSGWNIIDAFGIDGLDTKWVFNAGAVVVGIDSLGQQAVFTIPELVAPPGGGYEFAFDSRNRVWLGLTVGLEMLDYGGTLHDKGDDRHELYTAGLPTSEVRSVAVDSRDRVWVATPQGGAVWNGTGFQTFTTRNSGLLSDNLFRVRVDGSDRVWFLTDAGLSVFDPVLGSWTNYTSQNSGLLGNTEGLGNFYTSLDLNERLGIALIGTARGLSVFSFHPEPSKAVPELRIYPNPCILSLHSGVIVDGIPQDAQVRVHTLSGRVVAELAVSPGLGRAVWYPERQASGLYVVVVTSALGTRTGRVAVVRP